MRAMLAPVNVTLPFIANLKAIFLSFSLMDKARKMVVASLIGTSAIAWLGSIQQPDIMVAMTTYNPLAISLFTASWTAGMAAMMFPAITPMVLLYNRFVTSKGANGNQSSVMVQEENKSKSSSIRSLRVILFIGCYLLVWALTGIGILLGWSIVMNSTIMTASNSQLLPTIYGSLLIIAGAYQFTPIKKMCIGYCESPMSFFMRRWKDGTFGAVRMGLWHGMYCFGCCWAYFLLMVALGWMNLLWMGLFAGIIFGEKMWSRGIWVARAAGVGLAVTGILVVSGMLPSLVLSASTVSGDNGSNSMGMNDAEMTGSGDTSMTNDNTGESSMGMQDSNTSAVSSGTSDKMSGDNNNAEQSMQDDPSDMDSSSNQQPSDMNMQ